MEMEILEKTEQESHQEFDSTDSRMNSDGYLKMQPPENLKPESEIQQEPELADPLMSTNNQYVESNGNIHKMQDKLWQKH